MGGRAGVGEGGREGGRGGPGCGTIFLARLGSTVEILHNKIRGNVGHKIPPGILGLSKKNTGYGGSKPLYLSSLIRGRDLREIFNGAKHTNFLPSNADLLYLLYPAPRTPKNICAAICEAIAGRGWPGPAPREEDPRQELNGTQWTSLLATIFVLFTTLHVYLSRAPLNGRVCLPLPAAQVSWTLLGTFYMRIERSNPKSLGWFKE